MKTLKLTKRELQLIHMLLCEINNVYVYDENYKGQFKDCYGITIKEHDKVVEGLREKIWSK